MHLRSRFIAAACSALFALAGTSAKAESVSVFEMADGSFYEPASGLSAASKTALLGLLESRGVASSTPITVVAGSSMRAGTMPETPSVAPALENAVRRARVELQQRIEAAPITKPDVVTSYDTWVDVTLAVWNARTDEIEYVQAKKNGTGLKLADAPSDYEIRVKRSNGVNSTFATSAPERVVVAVRYPIFKDISGSKNKPKYELHDVVYTPYSAALHTPEMVAWGKNTLRIEIASAFEALRDSGVPSRAFPDRLMADVIDPKLVEMIAVIEHVGLKALSGPGAEVATEAFYVTIAGNQRDAYVYARSSAGALGLVQFIPSTYALMAKRKDLGLIKDFTSGMSDPVNAIKAQIAYLDAILASMPLAVKDLHYVDPLRVDEYLAAAYNTGETRVKRAIKRWGDGWSDSHEEELAALVKQHGAKSSAVAAFKKATLLPETVAYVKKLRQALRVIHPLKLPEA